METSGDEEIKEGKSRETGKYRRKKEEQIQPRRLTEESGLEVQNWTKGEIKGIDPSSKIEAKIRNEPIKVEAAEE